MPKVQELSIAIAGRVDESLIRSLNAAEAKLRAFGASTKTVNQAMAGLYRVAFPSAEIQKSIDKVSAFHQKIRDVGAVASGVGLGNILAEGIQVGIDKVGQFVDALKGASAAAANMQIQRSNLQAATQLTDQQMKDLDTYFWQKSSAVPVTIPAQMAAFKRIEETIHETDPGKRVALGKEESDRLLDLAALAVNPAKGGNIVEEINAKYMDVVEAVTNAQMRGVVNQQTLGVFRTMGLDFAPGMMKEKGLISQEQLSGWSSMSEDERDKILGEFAKDVHKRSVFTSLIDSQIRQATSLGGRAYGRAEAISKTTGGAEGSTADVLNFFNTKVGDIINGPLTQLLIAINAGFAGQIPKLQEIFDKLATVSNAGFKPILATLEKTDWAKVGTDILATMDALSKMFEKAQPIFQWMAKDLPEEIDTLAKITTAIEKVATAIEKAFGWALNFGNKVGAATNVTAGDRLRTAQDRLSGLQSAGASDDQILAAKKELMDAEKAQTDSITNLNKAVDKTTGNDFVHLNLAIEAATAKLLGFAGALSGGGSGDSGGGGSDARVAGLKFGLSSGGTIRGALNAYGEQIPFGSGGYRGSAPIPYGNYPITPGSVGAWGASHGALGINNGTIWDPTLGRNREGIELHAGGDSLISEGCVVIPRSKWPALKKKIIEDYQKGGHPTLHVGKEGASISDKPVTYAPTYHIQVLDATGVQRVLDEHGRTIHTHLSRLTSTDWERSAAI
jgi:hypothetical protein